MSISAKVAGVWKTMANCYVKRSGVWNAVTKVYSKQAGVWKQVYALLTITWTLKANFSGKRVGFVYYYEPTATYYAATHSANGTAIITVYTSTNLTTWTLYGTLSVDTAAVWPSAWDNVNSKIKTQYAFSFLNVNDSKIYIRFGGVWVNAASGEAPFFFEVAIIPDVAPPNALGPGFSYVINFGTTFNLCMQTAKDASYTMVVGYSATTRFGPAATTPKMVVYNANGGEYTYPTSSWIDSRSAVTYPLKRLTGTAYGAGKWVLVGSYQYLSATSNLQTAVTKYLTLLGSDTLHFAGVAFGNGMFVAISQDGKAITSTNSSTWTSPVTFATDYTFNGLFFYNGLFVGLASGPLGSTARSWASIDGIVWARGNFPSYQTYPQPDIYFGDQLISGNAGKIITTGSNDTAGIYAF